MKKSVRLFKNEFLEQFTHVHPLVPLVLWVPVIIFLFYKSLNHTSLQMNEVLRLSFLGLIVWTFVEYVLHRFAFHFPAESSFGKRFVYIMHGLHHDDPSDPTRLVMPPLPAILYSALLFSFFKIFLGSEKIYPFFAAFLIGYLCYDYIHYAVHHFHFKSGVGKALKKYHMLHHFRDHDAKWGVSSPFWDIVFKTTEVRTQKSSNHCHD